ncbi:hypothetical protein ACX80W_06875 [Arthrobacter sp. TMN-37]
MAWHSTEEREMKTGVKQYVSGAALLLLSTLFVPQGVSEFATSAATGEPVAATAGINLAVGMLMVLAAAALLAWGYWLTHRPGAPRRGPVEDPDEPLLRPGYGGGTDTPDWREHPLRPRDGDGGPGRAGT